MAEEKPRRSRRSHGEESKGDRAPFARLVSLNDAVEDVLLSADLTVIGRRSDKCDVSFPHPHISGCHCRFMWNGRECIVEDTSRNGTWINGSRRLRSGQTEMLSNGDEISLTRPRQETTEYTHDTISFIFQDLRAKDTELIISEVGEEGVLESYNFMNELGAGSFGTVWLAVHRTTKERCAVKVIEKERFAAMGGELDAMFDEVRVLNKLKHPHMVLVKDVFETDRHLVIALGLATGGDLEQLLERAGGSLSEPEARHCFHQILTALEYLHEQGIVHRDLKPENILIQDEGIPPHLKITDFGLARIKAEKAAMTTMCGTPLFVAPEIILQGMAETGYGEGVDLWSAGVILYQMLLGDLPFKIDRHSEPLDRQITRALKPDFYLPLPKSLSDEARDLLRSLLCSPARRISAKEALRHDWLQVTKRAKRPAPEERGRIDRMTTVAVGDFMDEGDVAVAAAAAAAVEGEGEGADDGSVLSRPHKRRRR